MKLTINHCSLARKDTEQEQRELYAHGIRYRLAKDLATQAEIMQELNKRQDKQQIIEILRELKVNAKI